MALFLSEYKQLESAPVRDMSLEECFYNVFKLQEELNDF